MINLVYGIKFKNKNLIKNVSLFRTGDGILFSGDAVDNYYDQFEIKTRNREFINEAFEYVLVGNEVAAVKMEVIKVIWSKTFNNSFILAVKIPKPSNDIVCSTNSIVFLSISRNGFNIQDDLREDGYDISEVVGE